jgi:hypothetical protein
MGNRYKVTIDPLGNPKVEGLNMQGSICTSVTKPVEDALSGGGANCTTEFKPEYAMLESSAEEQEQILN